MTEYSSLSIPGVAGAHLHQSGQSHDALCLLRDLARIANQSPDDHTILDAALTTARALLPVDDTGLYLYDPVTNQWTRTTPWIHDHSALCEHLGGILLQQPAPLVVTDFTGSDQPLSRFAGDYSRATAAVPVYGGGQLVGMICAIHAQPYPFKADEIFALETLAYQIGLALHRQGQASHTATIERKLDVLLQNTGDAVIVTDETGCITQINPAASTMFCLLLDDVRCRPLRDLPFPPELHAAMEAMLQRPTGSQMTFDARLADGRVLAVSLASADPQTPTTSGAGTGRMMMIARDMTRLRDAERARLNFIHSAAHDLRNPLSVTLSALSMLSKELRDEGTEMQHEIIAIGLHGIERIERLINGLLSLEHIENEAGLSHTLVDVRDLVERAIIDARPLIDAQQHTFSFDVPDQLPVLTGDIHWLTRALVQVLTNAAQFTPPGGSILLRVAAQRESICIEVEDTGPGIPPEDQTRIFEPFIRVSRTKSEGVGLGLATVKAVIERHHGRVFVKSEVGAGSVFGIILPIAP